MNLANKLTMFRIFLTVCLIVLLLFPFYLVNIEFPKVLISTVTVDIKYLIIKVYFNNILFENFYIVLKYSFIPS